MQHIQIKNEPNPKFELNLRPYHPYTKKTQKAHCALKIKILLKENVFLIKYKTKISFEKFHNQIIELSLIVS